MKRYTATSCRWHDVYAKQTGVTCCCCWDLNHVCNQMKQSDPVYTCSHQQQLTKYILHTYKKHFDRFIWQKPIKHAIMRLHHVTNRHAQLKYLFNTSQGWMGGGKAAVEHKTEVNKASLGCKQMVNRLQVVAQLKSINIVQPALKFHRFNTESYRFSPL